jgi:hypothetical protein
LGSFSEEVDREKKAFLNRERVRRESIAPWAFGALGWHWFGEFFADPVVALGFEFQGEFRSSRANDAATEQHVHHVRADVIQQALVVGD